jgi:16S rRNA (guanine527-N7)-methyltransferase
VADSLLTLVGGAGSILGRPLTEHEAGLFTKYLELLLKWQKTSRLVGRSNPGWIVENLLLDSLLFLRALPAHFGSLLDLGAGAGLPGIPIKIVKPGIGLILLEARRRRVSFLSAVVRDLRLTDVEVVHARAEEVAPRLAGRVDAVVMRCAGSAARLVPLARSFLRPGGSVVASGPPSPRSRLDAAAGWIDVPGAPEVRRGAPRRFLVIPGP